MVAAGGGEYHGDSDDDKNEDSIQERTAMLLERHNQRVRNSRIDDSQTEELKQKIRAKLEEHKQLLKDRTSAISENPGRQSQAEEFVDRGTEDDENRTSAQTKRSGYAVRGLGRAGREEHESIEDHLLERGRLRQEYLEAERRRREETNLANFSFRPHITRNEGEDDPVSEPVEVRMAKETKRAEERLRLKREEREEADRREFPSFTPSINKHITIDLGPGDVVERAMAWESAKERKRHMLTHEQRIRESEEATYRPAVNPRSVALAEANGRGAGEHDIYTNLYNLAPARQQAREEMAERHLVDSVPGNPAITRMAAGLRRDGPVGERLYFDAMEQQRRHRERVAQAEIEAIARAKASAEFHSKTQAAMRKHANNDDVGGPKQPQGHSLYHRAQNTLKKKDKLRQLENKAKEAQARPRLSKRSLNIAKKMDEAPIERLTKLRPKQVRELQLMNIKREINAFEQENVGSRSQSHHESAHKGHLPSDILDPELTFSPQINKISERIAAVKHSTKNVYPGEKEIDFGARLHRDHKHWHKDLGALRKEKEDKEMKECTFTPDRSQSKRTYERLGSSNIMGRGNGEDRPEQRLNKWLRKRDQKIERKMKEQHDGKTKGCTFEPNIDKRSKTAIKRKVKPGTGAPVNAQSRVEWNKQRRADQQLATMQKLADRDFNIISSPYVQNESDDEGNLDNDDEDHLQTFGVDYEMVDRAMNSGRSSQTATTAVETPDAARARRQQESERKHMLRMKKAHEHRRHSKASDLINQFRDSYSFSGNTNPDLGAIGASAPVTLSSSQFMKQLDGRSNDDFDHVLKAPVSAGAIDIHETF